MVRKAWMAQELEAPGHVTFTIRIQGKMKAGA